VVIYHQKQREMATGNASLQLGTTGKASEQLKTTGEGSMKLATTGDGEASAGTIPVLTAMEITSQTTLSVTALTPIIVHGMQYRCE
jgi:hypothetical protein